MIGDRRLQGKISQSRSGLMEYPLKNGFHRMACDAGQSLPEELVALAILALAVGLILMSISTGTEGVMTRHRRVSASSLARSQLELIADSPYRANPTAVPYPTVAPISGYTVDLAVQYWIAPDGPFTATVRDDHLQKITVSVSGNTGGILQLESYKVDR